MATGEGTYPEVIGKGFPGCEKPRVPFWEGVAQARDKLEVGI